MGQKFKKRESECFMNLKWATLVTSGGKEFVCNAGDKGSTNGLGRFPVEKNRYTFQYFYPDNSR